MSTPPSKRRRSYSCESQPATQSNEVVPQPLERSEPWFDDGNIILEAELTQFRVHRGVLSANSSVFKDMFVFGQPGGEMIEDCPVVHLSDTAEDLGHILKALYDRSYFSDKVSQPFATIAAMINLGRKYDITMLYREAVSLLSLAFPTTLENLDRLSDGIQPVIPYPGYIIDVINLSRQHDLSYLLPSASYLFCGFRDDLKPLGPILDGVSRPDGSLAILSPPDQQVMLTGPEHILNGLSSNTFQWLICNSTCAQSSRCNYAKTTLFLKLWCPLPSPGLALLMKWNTAWVKGLCVHCSNASRMSYKQGRQSTWNMLPSYYGLPPWEELTKEGVQGIL